MILRPLRSAVLLFALLHTSSRPLLAQGGAAERLSAMQTDSTAWQRVLVYVIRALSSELALTAVDSAAQPWELTLPSAEPQRALLEVQLRVLLRPRAVTPADSVVRALEFHDLRTIHDTARVLVTFRLTRRCPDGLRTTGWAWADTVGVARSTRNRIWGEAFSRDALVGDNAGC